jgi:hypothetical protein
MVAPPRIAVGSITASAGPVTLPARPARGGEDTKRNLKHARRWLLALALTARAPAARIPMTAVMITSWLLMPNPSKR